jgi:hypothetical protein
MIHTMRGMSARFARVLLLISAATAIATLSSLAAAQTVSDNTFLNTDWSLTQFTAGNGGSSTATQALSGGNPGAFRNVTDVLNAAPAGGLETIVLSTSIYTPFTYTPSVSGAIASINYSEDHACTAGCFGNGQSTGPALKQGANLYILSSSLPITGPALTWAPLVLNGLTAADFGLVNVTSGGAIFDNTQHPDFSASAAPIQVGFFRANGTFGAGYTLSAGIDNWQVTVTAAAPPAAFTPVPTLSEWALMLLAIAVALTGFASTRRWR